MVLPLNLELEREAREDDLPVENEFQFSIPIISHTWFKTVEYVVGIHYPFS